jgi:hypothetical protein
MFKNAEESYTVITSSASDPVHIIQSANIDVDEHQNASTKLEIIEFINENNETLLACPKDMGFRSLEHLSIHLFDSNYSSNTTVFKRMVCLL